MALTIKSYSELGTNVRSFEEISRWNAVALETANNEILIDFAQVGWVDAHLSAAILCVVRKMQTRNNRVLFVNSRPHIDDILSRNGLFQSSRKTSTGTVIPLTSFNKEDGVKYSNSIREHMRRMKFPQMTEDLRGKIYEGLDEVFINASMHSHAETNVFTCGQFFPKYERIDFTITDGGVGIRGAYSLAFQKDITAADAIDWAMADGNTTRIGDIPGGLGLKILRQFIHLNRGRFIIVTGNAYWMESRGHVSRSPMAHDFPGTSVTIEVNTSDTNSYELKAVPDPLNLW